MKDESQSGLHSFVAPDRAVVDAFPRAAALKACGKDNGKPGVRADYGPKHRARLGPQSTTAISN